MVIVQILDKCLTCKWDYEINFVYISTIYHLLQFFGHRLYNGSPCAILPLSCLCVCPILSVCNIGVLWPNGWMDQDASWYGGKPRPRWCCV